MGVGSEKHHVALVLAGDLSGGGFPLVKVPSTVHFVIPTPLCFRISNVGTLGEN